MNNEKDNRSAREVPTAQAQSELLALLEKLKPVQRDAVIAFIKAMLEN